MFETEDRMLAIYQEGGTCLDGKVRLVTYTRPVASVIRLLPDLNPRLSKAGPSTCEFPFPVSMTRDGGGGKISVLIEHLFCQRL